MRYSLSAVGGPVVEDEHARQLDSSQGELFEGESEGERARSPESVGEGGDTEDRSSDEIARLASVSGDFAVLQ